MNKYKKRRESITVGPMQWDRDDRFVASKWIGSEAQREQLVSCLASKKEEFKARVDDLALQLSNSLANLDHLCLLAAAGFAECFTTGVESQTRQDNKSEVYAEYILNIVSCLKTFNMNHNHPAPDYNKIKAKVIEVFKAVELYYTACQLEIKDKINPARQITNETMHHNLYVRGSSYFQHELQLAKDCLAPADAFFKKHFNVTSGQFFTEFENLLLQQERVLAESNKLSDAIIDLHKNEILTQDDREREINILKERHDKLKNERPFFIFELIPENIVQKNILEIISSQHGDNHSFASGRAPLWPTSPSIFQKRPIFKINGLYFCFVPQLIFRNIRNVLDELVRTLDPTYYKQKYLPAKANTLEQVALNFLLDIFPGSVLHRGSFYYPESNKSLGGHEVDGILVFDDVILLVEAKSGKLSESVYLGSDSRLSDFIEDNMLHGAEQLAKTSKQIISNESLVFYDKKGREVLHVEASRVRRIINIVVLLEPAEIITTSMSCYHSVLSKFDFHGDVIGLPWFVFINDLRVVAEVLNGKPFEFMNFYDRRVYLHNKLWFQGSDELDYLMYFIRDGLYKPEHIPEGATIFPNGYTDDLDQYYEGLMGRAPKVSLPEFSIPKSLRQLAGKLFVSKKFGFSGFCQCLFGCAGRFISETMYDFDRMILSCRKNNVEKDLSIVFDNEPGVSIIALPHWVLPDSKKVKMFLNMKMHEAGAGSWLCLILSVSEDDYDIIDFFTEIKSEQFSPQLDAELPRLRALRLARYISLHGQPERNQTCPCGSKIKFKKCCLDKK